MHAHFRRHTYRRHSHETYSFGVTEAGAQSFTCRGVHHTSAAGMVMAFNPEDPHDGHANDGGGFTYRMVHVSPAAVRDILAEACGGAPRLPLFAQPVLASPLLAQSVRTLHDALSNGTALQRHEALTSTVLALTRLGSTGAARAPAAANFSRSESVQLAGRVKALLDEAYAQDLSADDLAETAGSSRYAVYRAFRATYGLAPSEYQRQLRLRLARRLLAGGMLPADAAAAAGFADQAHMTRWFVRSFGIPPGAYIRA